MGIDKLEALWGQIRASQVDTEKIVAQVAKLLEATTNLQKTQAPANSLDIKTLKKIIHDEIEESIESLKWKLVTATLAIGILIVMIIANLAQTWAG